MSGQSLNLSLYLSIAIATVSLHACSSDTNPDGSPPDATTRDGGPLDASLSSDGSPLDGSSPDALPPPETFQLSSSDYAWIVLANKGTAAQLDNMDTYHNFNVSQAHPGYWPEARISAALTALLRHAHDKTIGQQFDVTYDVYDGTGTTTATTVIAVAEVAAFDVVPYAAAQVQKSNPTALYVHYMPWFSSREIDGYWSSHWTMANRNPDIVDAQGKRQIASHYYPLIGPYSSRDPDLVEYHLLLMKLSGLDGVLIDWYGTFDVYDYAANLAGANALIDRTGDVGIDFGIVYEDRTTENVVDSGLTDSAVEAAIADVTYIDQTYFNRDNYLQLGSNHLLLTFTPVHIQTGAAWQQILAGSGVDPTFLAIWGESSDLGATGDGEYSWVYNGDGNHLGRLGAFFQSQLPGFDVGLGSAYAGFRDYYQQGGWGDGIGWQIAHDGTSTLAQTLSLVTQHNVAHVQLVTWNDFGEGTMLEPTDEFGYTHLSVIQQFAGVSYTAGDLNDIHRLYTLRKQYAADALVQQRLDQVYYYLISLHLHRARALLDDIQP